MFNPLILRRQQKQEGESPFWISFSDLMSALMVLFLLVMAVTLISVHKEQTTADKSKNERDQEIKKIMQTIRQDSTAFPGVQVDESTFRIDLGDVVRFDSGRSNIGEEGSRFLRSYVPVLLKAEASDPGQKWIHRIVVEGFTDQDGTYLGNLALSLQRSQRVVCVLFDRPSANEKPLTDGEKRQIQDIFLVGGYSFNSMKASKPASRRVELKVEFWALDETKPIAPVAENKEIGQC